MNVTAERVRELLSYDPSTGMFMWEVARGARSAGAEAGRINAKGYRQIGIDCRMYEAHRLAWLHFYGEPPAGLIDHVNRDKADNRIANLRVATVGQNRINSSASKNNRSGVKGVRKVRNRWQAAIHLNGSFRHLGCFPTKESAHAAYVRAAVAAHGEFASEIEAHLSQARALLERGPL